MPRLEIDSHTVHVSTEVPYGRAKFVRLEITHFDSEGGAVIMTLDEAEAIALVRALDSAVDTALTYNYMGGNTP